MKHKQREVIYLVTSIGNTDGLVDISDENPETFDDEQDALDHAKEVAGEYGMRTYVYECVPVARVDRGKLHITKYRAEAKS